ncbi:hypothetical protein AB1I63_09510 [Streptococcus pneumoniae]
MFQLLISLYVALPLLASLSMKARFSKAWLVLYAIPVFLAILACILVSHHKELVVASLVLTWLIRPLAGKFVFGKVHLSHFIVHGVISFLLILGLFFF